MSDAFQSPPYPRAGRQEVSLGERVQQLQRTRSPSGAAATDEMVSGFCRSRRVAVSGSNRW